MSMLYGLTGSLNARQDRHRQCASHGAGFVIAVDLHRRGCVAFKFGAVPFHMWVPDVYQRRARSSVALLVSTAPKLASFALVMRLLAHGLGADPGAVGADVDGGWRCFRCWLGNFIAIAQTSIRRMLAYSAIANVGFILLGFVSADAAWLPRGARLHAGVRAHHAGLIRRGVAGRAHGW